MIVHTHPATVTPVQAGAQSGKVQRASSLGPGLRRDDEGTLLFEGSVG